LLISVTSQNQSFSLKYFQFYQTAQNVINELPLSIPKLI